MKPQANQTNPVGPIVPEQAPLIPEAGGGTAADAEKNNADAAAIILQLAALCWVAALYYPRFSRNWWYCRDWIVEGWKTPVGRLFLKVYLKHGLRTAEFLQAHPTARRAVRPLFVWAHRKGKEM